MRISTKGRYALRMLVDLAEHKDDGYISLKDIAKRQNISKKYLEQIVPVLNKTKILKTNRGFQGGYMLGVPPHKCTVGDILRLTEGSLSPVAYLDEDDDDIRVDPNEDPATIFVWKGLKKVISEYLDSITLQDIIDTKYEAYVNDYVI